MTDSTNEKKVTKNKDTSRNHGQENAEKYRNRIVTASKKLFAEHGIENVTMHQIAKAATIGQATLYRRYSHKGEICMEILSSNTQSFLKELDLLLTSTEKTLTPLEQLDNVITKIADYIDDKASMLVIIKIEYSRELQLLQFHHPIFLYLHKIISDLYTKSINNGEIVKLQTTLTAHTLVAALSPDLFLHQKNVMGFSKEEILAGIRQTYIEGVKKR
ncbi:TetR/AcrR family transcriptional regulator [Filibacter tadaridae]|uniref:DNA-binding transcriptional regulator EnvR n=1 Tax=Filibacter tadaridae TaxID=2483811 RepID=A0A3P5X1S6_9BACL|nr:TetR/AcrR family transcriptional regulator [Filibacter tadaridae]VDC28080.1 DNA-binding transcriptional regulator EnvR [Filibacter tadaridae]